jgi:hypothetical protein
MYQVAADDADGADASIQTGTHTVEGSGLGGDLETDWRNRAFGA